MEKTWSFPVNDYIMLASEVDDMDVAFHENRNQYAPRQLREDDLFSETEQLRMLNG